MERLLPALSDERRAGLARRQFEKPDANAPDAAEQNDPWSSNYRTPQQHDRDRLLYSSALGRLAHVTQVTAPESGHTFHNRLSHSLKVAQVGRRNAERLLRIAADKHIAGAAATLVETLDPDAIEASCLAHDLGHPPFGHIAEEELQKQGKEVAQLDDTFEGNAQSFRIVTRLAVRANGAGLNLTRQTLEGLLKYPWRHWPTDTTDKKKRERKWGYYAEDSGAFEFARKFWPDETADKLPQKSLEAEIVEWADDLTYAVHDMDDFYRAGLVPIDRIAQGGQELVRLEELLKSAHEASPDDFPPYTPKELVDAVPGILRLHGVAEPYRHTTAARAAMRDLGSELITRYLSAFRVEDHPASGGARLVIDDEVYREVVALKMLVVVYVIRHPGLAVMQHGQKRVIRDLFEWYYAASASDISGDRRLLPPGVMERLRAGDSRGRAVTDLISGLTETAAIQLHHRLSGGWTASALDALAENG